MINTKNLKEKKGEKEMKKRAISMLLAAATMASVFTGVISVQAEETTGEASIEEYADVDIEVFIVKPWNTSGMPSDEEDIIANYIEENFGGNWRITIATEGQSELVTRMSSGNEPDLILFDNAEQLDMFYEQGVLLEDWNEYADKLPNYLAAMTEKQVTYYTNGEGKLKGVSYAPGDQLFTFMIRQDWLDNLGLEMPTTPDELLDVMRAFTFNDPDGNGENDTYGFTAAGGGGVGEVRKLLWLFGDPNIYITEDGEVSNALLDGSFKEYLDYAKTIVDEGLINPDWYTLGWDDRKPALFNGSYGICNYPPAALLNEMVSGLEVTGEEANAVADMWAVMDTCGGKGAPEKTLSSDVLSVSATAAEDPDKMEVICKFLEETCGFNEHYAKIRQLCDGVSRGYDTDGTDYFYLYTLEGVDPELEEYTTQYYGIWNWGMLINYKSGNPFAGTSEEPDYVALREKELSAQVSSGEKWSNEYQLYAADSTLKTKVNDMLSEFEIKYIMGETTDYDGFVEEWLAAGGQEYLDAAKEQFITLGLIEG